MKKDLETAENIPENPLLYVICLSGFKKYLLYLVIGTKNMGFFPEKMQDNISQQPHHTCANIPESLLYLLLWGTLHWDCGNGRWTGETAKADSQLGSVNMILRRKLRASLDSKNTSHHKNQNKGIKKCTFPSLHYSEHFAAVVINYLKKSYSAQQVTESEISLNTIKC